MDILEELAQASEKVTATQAHAANQVAYRNDLIARARKDGITWDKIIQTTGLSRQQIANIIKESK